MSYSDIILAQIALVPSEASGNLPSAIRHQTIRQQSIKSSSVPLVTTLQRLIINR